MLPATRSRDGWRLIATAALVTMAAGLLGAAGADARQPRPNIVVIVTDDQPLSMMDERALPSTFELLADRGTTFTDSIVTTPLCCPSRAVLLTGQYGHNNGVRRNSYRRLTGKRNTLPAWLQAAGYTTAHVGRYLNGYEGAAKRSTEVAPGWDRWQTTIAPRAFYGYSLSSNGRRKTFGDSDRDYVTRVINRKSARAVGRLARRDRPFYLQVDHFAPHRGVGGDGSVCVGSALPARRDADAFESEPLPSSPAVNEADVGDKPSFVNGLDPLDPAKLEGLRQQYRCGLASLLAVDRGVKRVVSAVERAGEIGRTVFVFTSDHGYFFGEHRIADSKHFAYAATLDVPLIVRLPKRYRRGKARVPTVEAPVANIDLAPTIVRLARAEPCRRAGVCRTMDGRSLLPLLRGAESKWPDDRAIAVELDLPAKASPPICSYQGVRTPADLYVAHESIENPATGVCEPTSETEHYDLMIDPFELENLFPAAPGSGAEITQAALAAAVDALRDCAGIEGRDPEPASGSFCQ